jgi:hypothetical protein
MAAWFATFSPNRLSTRERSYLPLQGEGWGNKMNIKATAGDREIDMTAVKQ